MAKKRTRKNIDANPKIANIIKEMSIELGVPESQLWNLFSVYGIGAFQRGKINLDAIKRRSTSPKFRWNLDLDDLLDDLEGGDS